MPGGEFSSMAQLGAEGSAGNFPMGVVGASGIVGAALANGAEAARVVVPLVFLLLAWLKSLPSSLLLLLLPALMGLDGGALVDSVWWLEPCTSPEFAASCVVALHGLFGVFGLRPQSASFVALALFGIEKIPSAWTSASVANALLLTALLLLPAVELLLTLVFHEDFSFIEADPPIVQPTSTSRTTAVATASAEENAKEAVRKLFMTTFGDYDKVLQQVSELVEQAKQTLPPQAIRKLQRGEMKFDDFEIERKISSGGFCTVFRAHIRSTGRPCAVKSFSSADSLALPCLQGLVNEVITLTNLEHNHIIKVIGHCWAPQICMVLEYMPKGTLHDMLAYKALAISWESPLLDLAYQMASAVAYLHSRTPSIVHRDIKTRNILMRDYRTCKLADFGLSVETEAESTAGTLRYVAPEVAMFGENTVRSDVWSLGVCFWEMAVRARFPGQRAALKLPRRLPYAIPVEMRQVLFRCLDSNPERRITSAEVETLIKRMCDSIDDLEFVPNVSVGFAVISEFHGTQMVSEDETHDRAADPLEVSRMHIAELSQSQDVSQWQQERIWSGHQINAAPSPRSSAPPQSFVTGVLSRLVAADGVAARARKLAAAGLSPPTSGGIALPTLHEETDAASVVMSPDSRSELLAIYLESNQSASKAAMLKRLAVADALSRGVASPSSLASEVTGVGTPGSQQALVPPDTSHSSAAMLKRLADADALSRGAVPPPRNGQGIASPASSSISTGIDTDTKAALLKRLAAADALSRERASRVSTSPSLVHATQSDASAQARPTEHTEMLERLHRADEAARISSPRSHSALSTTGSSGDEKSAMLRRLADADEMVRQAYVERQAEEEAAKKQNSADARRSPKQISGMLRRLTMADSMVRHAWEAQKEAVDAVQSPGGVKDAAVARSEMLRRLAKADELARLNLERRKAEVHGGEVGP